MLILAMKDVNDSLIMLGRKIFFFAIVMSICTLVVAQSKPIEQYANVQKQLASGWNTWNTQSVLSHVKLPEGLAVNVGFKNNTISGNRYLHESYISTKDVREERIDPGYHAYDGSYTECTITWEGAVVKVETAHDGNDMVLLVTPLTIPERVQHLIISVGMLWNNPGTIVLRGKTIEASVNSKVWKVEASAPVIEEFLPLNTSYLAYKCNQIVGISVGAPKSLNEVQQIVQRNREQFEKTMNSYGVHKNTWLAQQSVLAWNMIYDSERKAVIAPVSRQWNIFFGGHYVLFDWDTYLSGLMAGFDNKNLAYANVIEVTKTVDDWGMVPNFVSAHGMGSPDRSQPPVGSMAVYELYNKYKDKWLLELTYERLLKWNRWWPKHRDTQGFLCWGTDPIPMDGEANTWQGAAYESGLDNSPMYDGVPFAKNTNQLMQADVGLMGLYIADCKYLASIAKILNKKEDEIELQGRIKAYSLSLSKLWNEEFGLFLNKRTDNGMWSYRLSPTLFYPMIAGVATEDQATRMVKEHLLNPKEFWGEYVIPSIARNDSAFTEQNYWRGRIWAPLNFLVYKGLKNYNLPEVTKQLVEKSNDLLMKNFLLNKRVYENYHASGIGLLPGEKPNTSDSYYHWGALLGYMYLLEKVGK